MADAVVRLKAESQEYEQKLQRAISKLQQMEKECNKVGGTMAVAEKADVEFARSLGTMQTKAQSAQGKISELNKAFTEAAVRYKHLTDEEKNSEFGKALGQSVEQLKGRLMDAKAEMKSVTDQTKNTDGIMEALASKVGLNVTQFTTLGGVLGAVGAALKVAKDAFFASEANIDEWGRTVESASTLYEGFLTSLNTGDISGYLSRISQISQAAREAYDAMDKLSTQKAINNSRVQAKNTEIERMQTMLRTGRYVAPLDGRSASMANGTKLSKDQLAAISKNLQSAMNEVITIAKSEIKTSTEAINKLYKDQASVLGMSKKEFMAGTSSWEAFEQRMEGYKKYQAFEAAHTTTTTTNTSAGAYNMTTRDSAKNPYSQYKAWGAFKDDGELYGKINEAINQRAAAMTQNFSMQARSYRGINKVEKSITAGGTGGSGAGSATTATKEVELEFKNKFMTQEEIAKLLVEDEWKPLGVAVELKLQGAEALSTLEGMAGNGAGQDPEGMGKSFDAIDFKNSEKGIKMAKDLAKEGESVRQSWGYACNAVSGIGGALQQIDNPAARVAGIIAEAIANVAGGFASALAASKAGKLSIWGWIAEAVAGTATMISTITAIHSATGYAKGGVVHAAGGAWVPGNSLSGDLVPAMLNSGELVLNKAQQGNLASQLGSANALNGLHLETEIREDRLVVMLNNGLRKRGKRLIG